MASSDARAALLTSLEPLAQALGLDVVDVELAGAQKAPLVRIYLDHLSSEDGRITLDELAGANRWIEEAIEDAGLFSGSYTLEVSSPGLARPLRRSSDFSRFLGERAQVRMAGYEGRRSYTGVIRAVEGESVTLEVDGEPVELSVGSMAKAALVPNFDDL